MLAKQISTYNALTVLPDGAIRMDYDLVLPNSTQIVSTLKEQIDSSLAKNRIKIPENWGIHAYQARERLGLHLGFKTSCNTFILPRESQIKNTTRYFDDYGKLVAAVESPLKQYQISPRSYKIIAYEKIGSVIVEFKIPIYQLASAIYRKMFRN